MSVLVVGGAGYIGSVTVERLLAVDESVIVYDNFSTGNRGAVSPYAILIEGDILNTRKLASIMRDHEIDTVMHFAAYIEVGESVANPLKYFDNNLVGAHSVMKAMIETNIRRFIFSSTAAVYGMPETVPITEDAPVAPINPYGLSKLMIEQMLDWHGRAHGLNHVILRYFNACGASPTYGEAHSPESHLIPNILFAASGKRDKIMVFGNDYDTPDGTCVRDYIHVEDLADAHIRAMSHLRVDGDSLTVNLGNSIGNSVLEVIETVKSVTGQNFPVEIHDRRPGDADRLVASSEKAQHVLEWSPQKGDIQTIVSDAWNFMQTHPDGYDK
ncbi:MAG TPA: UDP-glucose 4-epimerase GalE [Candidatus Hydrogenedentes bacterium]|nr:UDP-glucose 4-epimerase GalE [Candidatus Hydrogenedentota bacterium]HIB55117.1 UDP-glucose 4-epimerase GalE [Nitrospirales bacterium]